MNGSSANPNGTEAKEGGKVNRLPLNQILLKEHQDLHQAVESSPLVKKFKDKTATKEEYMQYLVNLGYDLETVETLFQQYASDPHLKKANLASLQRLKAVKEDISGLGIDVLKPSALVLKYGHKEHYEKIAKEAPYLLLAHGAVRYLAILYGGQQRADRLKTMWDGKAPLNLYQFSSNIRAIRSSFMAQLDEVGSALSDAEYTAFLKELHTAWCFAGDILDWDIRQG